MYASQKGIVYSRPRQPEILFGYSQGHKGASALTGSNKIIQHTLFTVYEAEYQKTINTKPLKHTI